MMTDPPRATRPHPAVAAAMKKDLRELAATARQQVSAEDLPRSLHRFLADLSPRLRQCRSYAEAGEFACQATAQLARAIGIANKLQAEVKRLEQERAAVEPFSADWCERLVEDMGVAGEHAASMWMRGYAQAFVAGRFDVCVRLSGGTTGDRGGSCGGAAAGAASTGGPRLADRDLSRRMLVAARAAEAGNWAGSLPALEILTESGYSASIPPELLYLAWTMRVRAVTSGVGDSARAGKLALVALERARAQRSQRPDRALAALYTAYGECLLDIGDVRGATDAAEQALRWAPMEPAGHVLRGLIAESVEDFTGADECYQNASESGGQRAVSGELFDPTPPNLLWQYGRRLRRSRPKEASGLIRRALTEGIRGSGPYPERKAYVDLALALDAWCRTPDVAGQDGLRAEAAKAYWEAGRRFAWVADEISAVGFLEKACELDPASARYAYERAEVLRLRAIYEDGTVDLDLLAQAAKAWQQAYALGQPGTDIPWGYVTRALIEHETSGDLYRPRPSWPAVGLLERGLLSDPANVRIKVQLSQAHRLVGNRWVALHSIEAARRQDDADELVFDQYLLALLEVEQASKALELLRAHGLRPNQPWLVIRQVQLHLTMGQPADALALLETNRPLDEALHDLYLGLCLELLHNREAARVTYERVAGEPGSTTPKRRGDLFARACYLLGRYDDAEDGYTPLLTRQPESAALSCELGQVLLARGADDRDDVNTGRRYLIAGIAATQSLWSLTMLEEIYLSRLSRLVADRGEPVGGVLREVATALRNRKDELRRAEDPRSELAAHASKAAEEATRLGALLGLSRLELTVGSAEGALERYVELAAEVPEAALGIRAAGDQLRRTADEQADRGEREAALATYGRLLALLERAPSQEVELTSAAHLRAALVAVELGRAADASWHAVAAFPPRSTGEALPVVKKALAAVFVRPRQYWQVLDAARAMSGGRGTGASRRPPTAGAAERLAAAFDPAALLRARRDDAAGSLFYLATPFTLRLGPALYGARKRGTKSLQEQVGDVRRRIEEEMGIPIRGVDLRPLPEGAALGEYVIELFEVVVARGTVPLGSHFGATRRHPEARYGTPPIPEGTPLLIDPLTGLLGWWTADPLAGTAEADVSCTAEQFVIRHLEAVIRTHLPRMLDIDDVAVWLASVPAASAPVLDRLSLADRLELLRLLRLLLREQVPVHDAGTIFDVVRTAGPEWSAPLLLPAVRQRLRSYLVPAALRGIRPARLPDELETALAAGCSALDPPTWQLPRQEAVRLAERLAEWHRQQPSGAPVVIRDARLRPFLWRVFATLAPGPVPVLIEEELNGVD